MLKAPVSEHVSLPIRTPDLTHLSNEELHALRSKVASMTREARKRANNAILKHPTLKDPWFKSMSVKGDDPEREEVMRRLEQQLLRFPEAFLSYAYANSLFVLDEAFRQEMLRRSLPANAPKKKKQATASTPPPEPAPTSEKAPWELLDDDAPAPG